MSSDYPPSVGSQEFDDDSVSMWQVDEASMTSTNAEEDAALAEAAQAAEDLTARLVPRPPEGTAPAAEAAAEDPETPLLVVGLEKELPAVLAKLDLPSRPKVLEQPGSAKVWTRRRPDGGTAMIVAARDAESLAVLLRPLPHYRRYGYVVFKGSKAVDKGVWPPQASPLVKDLK